MCFSNTKSFILFTAFFNQLKTALLHTEKILCRTLKFNTNLRKLCVQAGLSPLIQVKGNHNSTAHRRSIQLCALNFAAIVCM